MDPDNDYDVKECADVAYSTWFPDEKIELRLPLHPGVYKLHLEWASYCKNKGLKCVKRNHNLRRRSTRIHLLKYKKKFDPK